MKTEESIKKEIETVNKDILEKLNELVEYRRDEDLLAFVKGLRDLIIYREAYQAVLDED